MAYDPNSFQNQDLMQSYAGYPAGGGLGMNVGLARYGALSGNYYDPYSGSAPGVGGIQEPPIPRFDVPQYTPPAPQQTPGEGFAGPGTTAMGIIGNLLHGYMTATAINQERRNMAAKNDINQKWVGYQNLMKTAENLDLPQPVRDTAAGQIKNAIKAYSDSVSQYGGADKDLAPHKTGFLHNLQNPFVTHAPQLFGPGAASSLQQQMPTAPPAPSPQVMAQRTAAQVASGQSGQQITGQGLLNTYNNQLASYRTAGDEFQKAQQSGNQTAITAAKAKMDAAGKDLDLTANQARNMGVPVAPYQPMGAVGVQQGNVPIEVGKQQAAAAQMQLMSGTVEKLRDPNANFGSLSPAEKMSVGWTPEKNPLYDAYLSEVGADKTFKTPYDAMRSLQQDQKYYAMQGRPYEEIKRSTRTELAHDLQDPKIASQYGVAPLPQGSMDVPQSYNWLVEKLTAERYKATPAEKAEAKVMTPAEVLNSRNTILSEVVQSNPKYKDFFVTGVKKGTKEDTYGFAPAKSGWLESEADFNTRKQGAYNAAYLQGRQLGFGDDELKKMGITTPGGQQSGAGPIAAPPGVPATPAGTPVGGQPTQEPMTMWTFTTPDGKSGQRPATASHVKELQADPTLEGYTFTPYGTLQAPPAAPSQPAPPTQAPAAPAEPAPETKAAAAPTPQPQGQTDARLAIQRQLDDISAIDPDIGKRAKEKLVKYIQDAVAVQGDPNLPPAMKMTNEGVVQGLTGTLQYYLKMAQNKASSMSDEQRRQQAAAQAKAQSAAEQQQKEQSQRRFLEAFGNLQKQIK